MSGKSDEKRKSQIFNAPRLMISAPKSGSGKTTLTCAILQLLKNHGKRPVAFKCGPDFIDPMFHKQVLGIHSTNLDSFFVDEEEVRQIFSENMAEGDCAVIEGVMGLFDGLGGTSLKASSYDIVRITKTPILLVIDAEGASRSIVPLVRGFLDYDKAHSGTGENLIKGIFLNKVSKGTFQLLKSLIEEETSSEYGVKVIGYLPKDSKDVWKSRHLGLLLPDEIKNLKEQIQNTARTLETTLDFEALEKISNGALRVGSDGETSPFEIKTSTNSAFRIPNSELTLAVALDEAFCFYYHENLKILEKSGAKLVYFSPLHDKSLPNGVNGLLIGGGYPELYASPLQANESMRKSIKSAVDGGLPVMAECGGFMYLQEKIITETGESYEMCGAIKGESRYTGKLVRFGYADFALKGGAYEKAGGENPCLSRDFSIKGHEFHYFDSTNNGADFTASKPLSKKSWDCMIFTPTMLAGFPHLYYRSSPEIVRWFLETALTRTKPHIY
ncbi:MAG: cobyrinate a,c-diamide synthase [Treponema sp.]|nr:cobyrinate a,c-diamide synthase [Treponema sp.]